MPKVQKHYSEKEKCVTPSTELCELINVYREFSYACAKGALSVHIFKGTLFWKTTLGTHRAVRSIPQGKKRF